MIDKFHRRGEAEGRGVASPAKSGASAHSGVSLVELLIAMFILALVCIAWLQIIGIQSARKEARRREAVERLSGMMDAFLYCYRQVNLLEFGDIYDHPARNYRMIVDEGYDVVSGWKQHRQDNKLTKNLPSKLYNWTARKVTGIKLHDMNCGLKAYKNEVVKSIEVYGEMHRYIPYLAKNAGYAKIGEKPVHHQKRKYGTSKFGLERFTNGFLDLMSLWFLSKFGKKPMHFFGTTGILMFLIGGIMTVWIIAAKLIHQAQGMRFRAVTDQPLFYLALLAVVLGAMFFLAGFLGEMVSRSSSARNDYNVKERI